MNQTDSTRVQIYLDQLGKTPFFAGTEVQGSLEYMIQYYQTRTPRKRSLFRATGVLVIVLSAGLPVVASFGTTLFGAGVEKDLVVAVIATLIAIAAGFNTFFHWDSTWRDYTQALFDLYQIRAEWEAAKAAAILEPDGERGLVLVKEAQEKVITNAYQVAKNEMKEYFSKQQFPDTKTPK